MNDTAEMHTQCRAHGLHVLAHFFLIDFPTKYIATAPRYFVSTFSMMLMLPAKVVSVMA